MNTWLRAPLDALLLRGAAFARFTERPDAFFRGFVVIVAVALVVGLPALVEDVIRGFRPPIVVEPGEFQPGASLSLDLIRPLLLGSGVPASIVQAVLEVAEGNSEMVAAMAGQIERLPTILPTPLARSFVGLGQWLSRPFASSPVPLAAAALTTWLGYGIWVMLGARLLGGRATLHGFFGATAFFAVPHLLNVFTNIPIAGDILGAIAFLWGLAIYAVATAVSHRLSAARAIVAVFAPVVLLLVLLMLAFIPIAMLALLSGGSR